jgi:phosphotransferase system  glucose/maltose/N-acetylglucosamine-specific IIC component
VLGAAIIIVVLLLLPVVVLMSGAVGAAVLGMFLTKDAEDRHEGSELIELNR